SIALARRPCAACAAASSAGVALTPATGASRRAVAPSSVRARSRSPCATAPNASSHARASACSAASASASGRQSAVEPASGGRDSAGDDGIPAFLERAQHLQRVADAVVLARAVGLRDLVDGEVVEPVEVLGDRAARGVIEARAQLADDADRAAQRSTDLAAAA